MSCVVSPNLEDGSLVTGTIDAKFDFGYLVIVCLDYESSQGVLYHNPEAPNAFQSHTSSADHAQSIRKRHQLAFKDPAHPKPNTSVGPIDEEGETSFRESKAIKRKCCTIKTTSNLKREILLSRKEDSTGEEESDAFRSLSEAGLNEPSHHLQHHPTLPLVNQKRGEISPPSVADAALGRVKMGLTGVLVRIFLLHLAFNFTVNACTQLDWAALLSFKAALNEPYLGIFNTWSGTDYCDNWYGIDCDLDTKQVTNNILRGESKDPVLEKAGRSGYMIGLLFPFLYQLDRLTTHVVVDWKAVSGETPTCLTTFPN
ncbi:DNA damage-repair/toleration protein [Forsythia ovata]|uniref:DNA damage-repair/toleration protein n=1 Tax=Forsythia ovata TaxID=205694 RepID=A0ABD1PM63_9LAMI